MKVTTNCQCCHNSPCMYQSLILDQFYVYALVVLEGQLFVTNAPLDHLLADRFRCERFSVIAKYRR